MIPLRDRVPTRRRPYLTWTLVAINVAVFGYSIAQPAARVARADGDGTVAISGYDAITLRHAFVPCEIGGPCAHPDTFDALLAGSSDPEEDSVTVRVSRGDPWITVLTAMFMHGGWLHLLGNMLFLWIFGNNVEDAMSRVGYLLFYLLGGGAAFAAQWAINQTSDVPNIGASGAIAGVLGGYLLLHPRARVLAALPLGVFLYVRDLPAALVLLSWFGLQVLDGSAALVGPSTGFGIAYFAHIGGFIAGLALVLPLATRRRRPAALA